MTGMMGFPGYGLHTNMNSSPFGASMTTYTGYKNELYGSPLFQFGQNNCFPNMGDMNMFGGCCNHYNCGGGGDDGGLGKAMLWGGGIGLATGLCIAFAKPIGQFFSIVGKGLWSGMKTVGKTIGNAATWCWNGIKSLFSKKSDKTAKVEKSANEVKTE